MLQNTAILKVGGGLAAISGTAGAGYYAHTQGIFKSSNVTFENESEKNYLIVKTTGVTATATGELYDVGLFSSQKNFTCSATISGNTATTDDNCEIYKLSDEEKKLAKAITNNHSINAENIKKSGNYLKITSPKLIDAITKWEDASEQLISIAQKTEPTKLFGKLTPVYRIKNGEIVARKTSFLYAKVKDNVGTTITQPNVDVNETTKNYQCQLSTTKFPCKVLELTLNSTNKTLKASTTAAFAKTNSKTKDTHFQIQMEEKYLKQFSFEDSSQTIDIVAHPTVSGDEKYAKLTPLFKVLDQEINGENSFFLSASTSETGTNAPTTGYKKCKIGNSKETIDCEIYKFTSDQDHTAEVSFATNPTKTESAVDIKQGKLLVIKLSNSVANINDLKKDGAIKLVDSSGNTSSKEFTLNIKSRLFIDPSPSSSTLTVNTVHLLDI